MRYPNGYECLCRTEGCLNKIEMSAGEVSWYSKKRLQLPTRCVACREQRKREQLKKAEQLRIARMNVKFLEDRIAALHASMAARQVVIQDIQSKLHRGGGSLHGRV